MSSATLDWLNALDLERAVKNVELDMKGDWYRDPWGWPEPAWALKAKPRLFQQRLSGSGVWRCQPIDVPKENFGSRPAMVMDPMDRVMYQALVDRISVELIGGQPAWAYGWRLVPGSPERGRYARNDFQWDNFTSQLNGLAGFFDCGLKTDVVSFFASVDLSVLADDIHARSGIGKVQDRILDMLDGWNRVPGRKGLPQRSAASAVLANMYLKPIDDLLGYYGAVTGWWALMEPKGAAARWMDDVWLFGDDAGRLRHAQLDLQRVMRDIGLDMNLSKTDVLEGEELMSEAREIEHSAVDTGFAGEPIDSEPLDRLIVRLLDRPEHASRTSVRFATTRMRWHDEFSRVGDFVEAAPRLPHGADHVARLFRSAETWRELPEWYCQYARTEWGSVQWSVAQLGTMFPSEAGPDEVRDYFAEVLSSAGGSSLPITTVAAQRLAKWAPDTARVAIREASKTASDPLARRSLALAAVHAGEERTFVRKLLGEFEENATTLGMLDDRGWKPAKVVNDFYR